MSAKRFTITAAIIIAVYDVYLVATEQETISRYIYDASTDHPMIALVAGVLVGHLFWPVRRTKR